MRFSEGNFLQENGNIAIITDLLILILPIVGRTHFIFYLLHGKYPSFFPIQNKKYL
jgi:hypothetical protein